MILKPAPWGTTMKHLKLTKYRIRIFALLLPVEVSDRLFQLGVPLPEEAGDGEGHQAGGGEGPG